MLGGSLEFLQIKAAVSNKSRNAVTVFGCLSAMQQTHTCGLMTDFRLHPKKILFIMLHYLIPDLHAVGVYWLGDLLL